MCGLTGIFDLGGVSPVDKSLVKRMNDAIAHRGPDGEGFYFSPGVGFGHRRLSIIDVAGGHQPIFNEDESVALIYNGEIYNYQHLMAELKSAGHVFRTHCDTETVVHAWEQWGADSVTRFRGMFAFALYDRKKQTLFLARDRLGKKPLYYTVAGRYLIFGSELKALLAHPQFIRRLDHRAVDEYLALGYVPDPATIYQGVFKLAPGSTLQIERGKPVPNPVEYWRLRFKSRDIAEPVAASELIQRLDESVRIRLMSEVPLGAFLSGGVDSSGIVSSMARQISLPVQTFALGFGSNGTNELSHARRIAEKYNTTHHAGLSETDPLAQYRAQAAIFDEPFADDSSIPTLQVCKLARNHVTVALSGDAGDEVFAGYRRYRMHAAAEAWRARVPDAIRQPLFGTIGNLYPKLDWAPRWLRAKYTFQELALSTAGGYFRTVCKIQDDLRTALYSPSMRDEISEHHPADVIAEAMREADTEDTLACAQYADCKTYLPGDILTKVDRASMAVSLEVRVPLLDHEFVEWAATLPRDLKIRGNEGKYILKKALEPRVPQENLYREKSGFATPLRDFFKGDGAPLVREALLGSEMADSGLFERTTISSLVSDHQAGRRDNSKALWTLLMFDGFLKEVHFNSSRQSKETLESLAPVA